MSDDKYKDIEGLVTREELQNAKKVHKWGWINKEFAPDNLHQGYNFRKLFPTNTCQWGWSVVHMDENERLYSDKEQCGHLRRGMWHGDDCSQEKSFICEDMSKLSESEKRASCPM